MQDFEFMSHQIISTTVHTWFRIEPETSTPRRRKKLQTQVFSIGMCSQGQSSGTSLWVSFTVSLKYQNVHLLARDLPSLLELIVLIRGKPSP